MRTLLANKSKHYKAYADTVAKLYKQLRYGIDSCKPTLEMDLAIMRKELVDWQANEDAGALSSTNISYRTWLAVEYDDMLLSRGGAGYVQSSTAHSGQKVGFNYVYPDQTGSQNVIEVNAGGCITRINLNPAITVNQNSSFIFLQNTPATVWDIVHNLGLIPNIFMEDLQGNDIMGNVQVIDTNHIKVFFNQPVAGKAYLS